MAVKMLRVVGEPAMVRHPETGQYVVPDRSRAHRSDDPLVQAYPWMFESDTDVEQATAAPGERRTVRR